MDAPQSLRIFPGGRIDDAVPGDERTPANPAPGPVLFLGGCSYAAAYLVLGLSGFAAFSGVLALAGTAMILLGLRKTWQRA